MRIASHPSIARIATADTPTSFSTSFSIFISRPADGCLTPVAHGCSLGLEGEGIWFLTSLPSRTAAGLSMAPTVVAAPATPAPTKIKRPIPPGIQTNGVPPSRSSPSPSVSAKRAPSSAVRQPSNPPTATGPTPTSARPPNRARRDGPGQVLGRGQRSAGLRSASIAPEFALSPTTEPPPYGSCHAAILSSSRHV